MKLSQEEIKEIAKKRNYKQLFKKHNITFDDIRTIVPFSESIEEAIFCIRNEIKEKPKCQYPSCDKNAAFTKSYNRYSIGCCEDHAKKLNTMKKYGVENVSQLKSIKEKKKATTLKNYGVENPSHSEEIKKKRQKTMQEKFGGYGYGSKLKDKIHQTNLEKYGATNPMKSETIKIKSKIDWFNRIKERLKEYVIPKFSLEEYLEAGSIEKELTWECSQCKTEFQSKVRNGSIPQCPKCYPKFNCGISKLEREFSEKLKIDDLILNDRTVLNGKEIDIVVPSKKIAIEFNGLYWHSELNGKDRNYHLNKTLLAEEKGYQLIHVFDKEYLEQKEIVLSIIHSKLGIFDRRIYARKTIIREITTKEKDEFLENNHLQGKDSSSIKLGLFYNDELVSVMTFGKPRFNKNHQYEMHRFCSKINTLVIGGASKLFKYFTNNYKPESIITYADRRYSNGESYKKIGFTLKSISKPNPWYFNRRSFDKLFHRMKFQKHKQKEVLENFNPNLTAWENMQLNHYDRIWDCGNYVFSWKNVK